MSKVAEYLQEHILGEVVTNQAILEAMSFDASVLEIRPEMVVYPRVTNDIRKVTRFAWQLAEKGHVLSITVRGGGTDTTGGAIGTGLILATKAHINEVLEFDAKQKLARIQPGLGVATLSAALAMQGMGIPALTGISKYATVGGAVGKNTSGRYGNANSWVSQLEVVLANGDILQTGRMSKRDLNKRKGIQTFEGEIYRNLDNLIEDNKQLIEKKIGTDTIDAAGYSAIAKVKQRDGSFDLTPLFIGSQGTLGIVSEMIVKCDFVSTHCGVVAAVFASKEAARDALDGLKSFEPTFMDLFDGEFFAIAAARGKKYSFYSDVDAGRASVVLLGFNDFSDRARHKKLKKVAKFLDKSDASYQAADGEEAAGLLSALEVPSYINVPSEKGASAPPLLGGAYVPLERFEEFSVAVAELATKHHITLLMHLRVLDCTVFTRPTLQLHKVGDKQKIFKLLDEYSALVDSFGGILVANEGEGRVKARFAYAYLDDDVRKLYAEIKTIFDPYGIMNPGIKQASDVRQLVAWLRKDYDTAGFKDEINWF
jgi:FAD/FMN-containing dehydrogenase